MLDKKKAPTVQFDVQDRNVIVIGGGDTAVDCVGTALRMGAKSVLQFSRRKEAEKQRPDHTPWPCWADTYRVDYAHAEASALHGRDPREYLVVTKAFLPASKDSSCVGKVLAAKIGPDGSELRDLVEYKADLVILAMGFTGPDDVMDKEGTMLPRDKNRNFDGAYGDYRLQGSPWKNLFACGDCRHGASLVVTAIAEGRDSAARIDEFLMGETLLPRAAPLKANPSFFQQPKAHTLGQPSRRRKIVPKVSEAFERGLLVEPARVDEPEAEIAPQLETSAAARPVAKVEPDPLPALEEEPASSLPLLQDSRTLMWLSLGLAGLCTVNMALTAALLRANSRR